MVKQKQEMSEKASYTSLVPAVEQAVKILISLSQSSPSKSNLTDICKKVGIHKSKGYSILNTLQKFGFVQRDADGKVYTLGPGLISLGRKVIDSMDFRQVADPFLERLCRETDSTACFAIIADDNVFVIGKHEGEQAGVTIRMGHRYHVTHGAHGKAIIAFVSDAEKEKVLSTGNLYFHGEPSKLDRPRLERELARCRQEGYAEDVGEMGSRVNTVAAPVFTSGGRPVAVVVVVGLFPKSRIKQYGALVAEAGRNISELLGADVKDIYAQAARAKMDNGSPLSL